MSPPQEALSPETDLRQQLQTLLGEQYVVERELGGGGMSRVFLATETALGRKVVIKVLPPEMAAGVNIERFRREITLAAGLQHPHIVPLLAAGRAGDLFYYTMPLVEGESLRAKVAREGALPIALSLRILRDVAEALAYAHAHGVVHRDIKPDNVLISGDHAMVTDFGVAKAVSAASGESSLTSLGLALGTPAYMAPEQAAADPHVDHRADLYALGAMAYEMLSGRPPFAGMSAPQVLAAHVTQFPDPLSARRPSVAPALNALVMRLLEKSPADRVQSAQELASMLDGMATPTGGLAPTGATPAFTSGERLALQRAHPVRVTLLYLLASAVVLGSVYVLVLRLGLPWWVLVAAVVLLVIGLPIILTTGSVERQRIESRTTSNRPTAAHPAASWLTWRRAITGGGLAFTGLATVAALYTAMRLLGIGPVGTLVASGALKERQPIVLADFENHTRDSTLGPALTEAFRVDLSQSPIIRLVDPTDIKSTLSLMQRNDNPPLTEGLARDVAVRRGSKAFVSGQIDQVGTSYVLSANVNAAEDGHVLTAVRETANDESALIPALDRLSKSVRERIGESLTSIRANEPLADVTTGSLEALRYYTAGVRTDQQGDMPQAIRLIRRATEVDTGFAMAYRKLASLLENASAPRQEQVEVSTRAFLHRDRLPDRERELTAARYYVTVERDDRKAAEAYRAVLAIRPDDDIALNNLAIILNQRRQYAAAESLLARAITLDQGPNPYVNMAIVRANQGHWAAAESTVAALTRRSPQAAVRTQARVFLASAQFDYDRAIKYADSTTTSFNDPDFRFQNLGLRSALRILQGKASAGEAIAREAMDLSREQGDRYVQGAIYLGEAQYALRNRPDSMMATIAEALRRFPLDSFPALNRPYNQLARAYFAAGQLEQGKAMLAAFERTTPPDGRTRNPEWAAARGDLAAATGRVAEAAQDYHEYQENAESKIAGSFELGELYRRYKQPDSARVYYEIAATEPDMFRVFNDWLHLAATYQRLGELAEQRGDKKQALQWYGKFVDLWKDADPDLQPLVKDVRRRMASLQPPG